MKFFFAFAFWIFLLAGNTAFSNVDLGVGPTQCTVTSSSDAGDRSLRDLLSKTAVGEACRYNLTFYNAMRIDVRSPYDVSGTDFLLTGADLTVNAGAPLGVVVDGRLLNDACVIRVQDASRAVIQAMTIYVRSDRTKAICDAQGRSILDESSPAYRPQYSKIRVCRGDRASDCDWSAVVSTADGDQDGIPDNRDRCDGREEDVQDVMRRNGCLAEAAALTFKKIDSAALYDWGGDSFQEAEDHEAIPPPPVPVHGDFIQCHQNWNYELSSALGNACDDDWDNDGALNWDDECPIDPENECLEETSHDVPPPSQDVLENEDSESEDGTVNAAGGCSLKR